MNPTRVYDFVQILGIKRSYSTKVEDETIEQSCSDFLAHTLEVCKSAHRYNKYSAI
jgi:hypothetical protein